MKALALGSYCSYRDDVSTPTTSTSLPKAIFFSCINLFCFLSLSMEQLLIAIVTDDQELQRLKTTRMDYLMAAEVRSPKWVSLDQYKNASRATPPPGALRENLCVLALSRF